MKVNKNMKWVIVVGVVIAFVASVVVMTSLGSGGNGYNYDGDWGYEETPNESYSYDAEDELDMERAQKSATNSGSPAGAVDDLAMAEMPDSSYHRDVSSPISIGSVSAGEWNRMIKKDANIRIKGENPYEIYSSAKQKAMSVGGRVSDYNENVSDYEDKRYQTITCTLSVPTEHFDSVIETINQLGDVIDRSESEDDVTEEYVDLESRLSSKKRLIAELNKFYSKAKDVDDSIDIYYQIQQVQEEVDQIEGRMKYLRAMTSMSRIHLTISQPDVEIEPTSEPSRFVRGLHRLWNDIQDGAVWFIGFLIMMIVISAVIFLLVLLGLFIYNRIRMNIGNKKIE